MLRRTLLGLTLVDALARAAAPAPQSLWGFAAHYRPGLMERVAQRRGLPQTPCMVATPYIALGRWVEVKSQKYRQVLRCRVTDVPHPRHLARLKQRNIVVELNFASARILCGIQRSKQEPPRACPVRLRRL